MLYSKLKDMDVKTPLGDKHGKLSNLSFDAKEWKVHRAILSEGFLSKRYIGVRPQDMKVRKDDAQIEVPPDVDGEEVEGDRKSSLDDMLLDHFMKKDVFTSDDEKVGKVYDLDLLTDLKRWDINKVLIKTGWMERRLRISPSEIEEIGEDIKIKVSREDIEKLSRPEMPEEEGEGEKDQG